MKTFSNFYKSISVLTEAVSKDMLDVSIPNADKAFRNPESFFEKNFTIEEKLDGTKLTLYRNDEDYDPKNFKDNWVVAYKNSILHFDEFDATPLKRTLKQGSGISQYKIVFEHLRKHHKEYESIPKNTEFFIEFLMSKNTLTRDYVNKHRMIIIGYTHNAKVDTHNDFRFYTKESKLNQKENEHYADLLKIDLPMPIFKGKMDSFDNLKDGVEHSHLKTLINQRRDKLSSLYEEKNWEELYKEIKEMFLDIPSFYGGKMEGVVMKDSADNKLYKFLQADQHDKETRDKIKQKTRMSKEEENAYYNEIKEIAKEIIEDIGVKDSFSEMMRAASSKVNSYKFPKKMHTKKNDHQVREDLHTTLKMVYEKTKNGWAGVIGKFRIVTKEHVKMIEYALDKYKGATVMIVSGKRNDGLIDENIRILKKIFEGKPVQFFAAPTGNAVTLERRSRNPIVAYVCGPDREKDYQSQLDNGNYDSIVDVYDAGQRGMVSATNAEKALRANNKATLRKIIHPVAYEHLDSWSRFYMDSE